MSSSASARCALGLALSLPLALLGVRSVRMRWVLLTAASVIQTIPSLALLALFYPLLLALSLLTKALTGAQFSALGFLPSLLALTLYSMLPILRNTVTGLLGVDAAVKEAAHGVGMTPMQSLIQVELPLALPVIMAGVRTASVLVIGTATLSTPVGQTSLGNYIFTGLQTQNWVFVVFGCVAAAALALAADQLLGLFERLVSRRDRSRLTVAGAVLLLILGASALLPLLRPQAEYVIGAKGFPEQYILASLMDQRLADAGLRSVAREDLGSAVIFNALVAGDVDAYVDYTGTIWTNTMHRADTPPRDVLLRQMSDWLRQTYGVRCSGRSGSRTPMCWPCAATAPRRSASTQSRTLLPSRRAWRLAAITRFSAVPNGRRCARPTDLPSARSGRCSHSSCTRRWPTARSTSSPPFPATGASRNTTSSP